MSVKSDESLTWIAIVYR